MVTRVNSTLLQRENATRSGRYTFEGNSRVANIVQLKLSKP